jgi:hypothetical protein
VNPWKNQREIYMLPRYNSGTGTSKHSHSKKGGVGEWKERIGPNQD